MLSPRSGSEPAIFHIVMIKPTHYDDDGYPIQWLRSAIPSNTLACLNALAEDAQRRADADRQAGVEKRSIFLTRQPAAKRHWPANTATTGSARAPMRIMKRRQRQSKRRRDRA